MSHRATFVHCHTHTHHATFVHCHTHTANRSILGFLSPLQRHTVRHLYIVTHTHHATFVHCHTDPEQINLWLPLFTATSHHATFVQCRHRHVRIKCYVRDDVIWLLVKIVSSSQRHRTTNLRVKEPQHCTERLPRHAQHTHTHTHTHSKQSRTQTELLVGGKRTLDSMLTSRKLIGQTTKPAFGLYVFFVGEPADTRSPGKTAAMKWKW